MSAVESSRLEPSCGDGAFLRHLHPGGKLIFSTQRDFLKATSAVKLNRLLCQARV